MAERTVTPAPPELAAEGPSFLQRLLTAVLRMLSGKLNCVGDVELAVAPAVTTVLSSPLITANSQIVLTATNALAAAEVALVTGVFVSPGAAPGQAVINHAANAGARTFRYAVIG